MDTRLRTVLNWSVWVFTVAGPAAISWLQAAELRHFPKNWREVLALTLDPALTFSVPVALALTGHIRAVRTSGDTRSRLRSLRRWCGIAALAAILLWHATGASIVQMLVALAMVAILAEDYSGALGSGDAVARWTRTRVLLAVVAGALLVGSALTLAGARSKEGSGGPARNEPLGPGIELLRVCVAETPLEAGGYFVTDSSACSIPLGVVITRLVLTSTFDDGGDVFIETAPSDHMAGYIRGMRMESAPNSPGTKELRKEFSPVSLPVKPGDNMYLRVEARNAITDRGEPLGRVFGRAVLSIYGTLEPR